MLSDVLGRRNDNFLAIRIVAAAVVIYGHVALAPKWTTYEDLFRVVLDWGYYSGDIAVNAFFLISGLLVSNSFIRQRSLYRFAKARFLRIVPGFFVNVVLLALPIGLLLTTLDASSYLHDSRTWGYITTNLKFRSDLAWTLPGVFENLRYATVNGSQWTLPAEVRMYLLLVIFGAFGLLRTVRTANIVLAVFVAGAVIHPDFYPLDQTWFQPAAYFALGVALFINRAHLPLRFDMVLAAVILAVITRRLPIYPLTFALALAAVVLWSAYKTRPLRWLERGGDPSYGIYLWGWPAQQVVATYCPDLGLAGHVIAAVTLATLAGYLSWHLIESRMLRLK